MRVAVIYASRHGSTREVALAIGRELRLAGCEVTIGDAEGLSELPAADGYVFGSAVYAGRWLEPVGDLISVSSRQLSGRPVWLFSVGPVGEEEQQSKLRPDISALVEATDARGYEVFAGKLDLEDLSLGERLLARATKSPIGDFRDWDAIRGWARRLARELEQPSLNVAALQVGPR